MNEYVLSICIPTYNRCNLLKETLDNLVNQIINTIYNVEICISDNCSTDETDELLIEYEKKYPFIKTNTNQFSCGYDYNLCRVVNMAKGIYIWTLSDDDIVLQNSIDYIARMISEYNDSKASVIFLKPKFVRKDEVLTVMKSELYKDKIFTENIYANEDEALIQINWLVSFVSTFVLRKEYISDNFSKFFGSGFIHTPMIMDCIKKGNVIVTNNIHILCRQNNSGGYNIYKYFGTNFMNIFNYYKENNIYKITTIDKVITEWLRVCVRGNVIYCRLNRNKSFEFNNKISDLLIPYRKNKYFIFKILPILIMPNLLFKIFSKWKKW